MSGVWTKLRDGTLSAGAAARDRMNVTTLRLAITGLTKWCGQDSVSRFHHQ
jgi:hypothetical protein